MLSVECCMLLVECLIFISNTQKINKKQDIKKFDLEDRFIVYTIGVNSYNL